jgi:hypothetical protein
MCPVIGSIPKDQLTNFSNLPYCLSTRLLLSCGPMATKMDLKTLIQKSQKGNESEEIQQFQSLSMEEMGQEVMSFGKYQKKTFQVVYEDKGYVKWCAQHTHYDKSGQGMKKWLVYLRRRLEVEGQE